MLILNMESNPGVMLWFQAPEHHLLVLNFKWLGPSWVKKKKSTNMLETNEMGMYEWWIAGGVESMYFAAGFYVWKYEVLHNTVMLWKCRHVL